MDGDPTADLSARLDQYEVTAPPVQARLRLVWVRPDEVPEPAPVTGVLAVLDAYRITRVPEHRHRRAAS